MLDLFGLGNIGTILAGVGAVIAAVWGIFAAGKRSERKGRKIRDLEQEAVDREKLDQIKPSSERDTIDRLRNNGF